MSLYVFNKAMYVYFNLISYVLDNAMLFNFF